MRRSPLILCLLLFALHARGEAPPSGKVIDRYKQMLAANPAEGVALDRLWKIYLDQGKADELIAEYQTGGTFGREMVLGHLFHKAAQSDKAAAAFSRAAKLDAKSPLPLFALARLEDSDGHGLAAAGWYEKAMALLGADDPRLPETLLQLGAAWLSGGDGPKATEAWERVAALRPADLDLRRRLADAYERNFLPARAIVHLEYIEAHAPSADRAPALQRIALIHQGAGRQDAAIAALEKALALTSPGNWLRPELESQLIRLHQRYHRTVELEARWKKFAAENPRDIGALLQLIELYERLGDLENQRAWLYALTKLAPKSTEYRLKLARLLTQMDAPEPAAAMYDELLKEQPANSELVFDRAKLDMLRNDADPAVPGSRLGGAASARARIASLLSAKKNDDAVRARALEFYEQNRLLDLVEARLTADAASGADDALTALANFYFAQHREADAKRALERMASRSDTPAKQAAGRAQSAQIFKSQNDLENALMEMKKAVALQPANRDYHLALGDLHMARGEHSAAQAEFIALERLSGTNQERIQADQKLFECFRSQAAAAAAASNRARAPAPFSAAGVDGIPDPNPALDQYLARMEEFAGEENSEEIWLRLGRWRVWNHDLRGAASAINAALKLKPKSVQAYELLATVNATNGPSPRAVQDLQKLADLDPANRSSYQRRAGQLELQAGRILEALDIFQELASKNPGNLDALTDLALSQQRAERWNEAVATWQKVYALSPASRKKEAMIPLIRAYEKLDLHAQAAGLQMSAIEAASSDRDRFALFGDMLIYCARHNLLEWAGAQFEKRRQLRPDDYFTEVALGRILKASGKPSAAFELFADASYAAPNQAEALPDLIREAEELHKLDSAVKLQAQLIRIAQVESPDGLEKLAQLQEKNYQIDDASRTWDRIVAKFPRDATAINHAIQFTLNWGESPRALALLRKARALEPTNLHTLVGLAELAMDTGETAEAEKCLDEILRLTSPEKPGDPLRFPAMKLTDAGRLQTAYLSTVEQRNARPSTEAMRALRSFWVDDAAEQKSEHDVRLHAIRQRAEILRGQPAAAARSAWIARWLKEKDAPSEALWALYYAGEGDAALDRLEAMTSESGRNSQTAQAFVWLALQTRRFTRLRTWLQDQRRTPTERDFVFIALGQSLDANGGQPDSGLVETLFAEGTHLRLWQAALLFASRNRFREAAQLGQRVFDQATTQRAIYGEELAHWYLILGMPDKARAVLKMAIQTPAEAFEAPAAAALRDYYLLLPEDERSTFVTAYLAGINAERQPLHSIIASTLLHGLSGDENAAKADLTRLLDMRVLAALEIEDSASASVRHWRFLLNAGIQLQAWKLNNLAADLWQKALADEALVQLEGDQIVNAARDLRQRLCALHAAAAPLGEMHQWMEAFTHIAPRDGPVPLAAALATAGAYGRAIEIYRQIWERDRNDPEILRNLLSVCRSAGDDDTAAAILAGTLSDTRVPLNEGIRREFVLQYAELLERRGEVERARDLLAETLRSAPGDTRLLQRLGQLQEKTGQLEEASAVYRQMLSFEPGNAQVRLALCAILERQARVSDAIEVCQKFPSPETEARRAILELKNHQPEEALAALERVPPPQNVQPALELADALASEKDFTHARIALQAALARSADSRISFPLESKLIELMAPADGPAAAQREFRRLRKLTAGNEGLLGSYLDFASRQSARLNVTNAFSTELHALWAAGKGPIPAGLSLLKIECEAGNKQAAISVVERLLARDDASDAWLQIAADELEKAPLQESLIRVQERLAQINPLNEQNALNLAHSLRQMGRKEAAGAVMDTLALRAALSDELAAKVADGFAQAGELKRACALFAQGMRGDPYARNYAMLIQYAQLQSQMGDLSAAKKTLRVAFTNPGNRNFDPIIDWIVASNRLDHYDAELLDFRLSPARITEARLAAFAYFEKSNQAANATALVDSHPEILRSGLLARLRSVASKNRYFPAVAALLEKLSAQTNPNASLELSKLFGEWADSETATDPKAALAHLRKARDLHPELFDIVSRLSKLQNDIGDRRASIETLESFLANAKNSGEIEKARAQLANLKAM